ncbi:hypothetical protein TNCV_1004491 [Trichonephila clavipes]|nr:hypothetical protein TNCV_1004491 [Trichonephila clavipes]
MALLDSLINKCITNQYHKDLLPSSVQFLRHHFGDKLWPRYPSGQGNGLVDGVRPNSSLVPLKTRHVGDRCTLNLSRLKRPLPVCVVWMFGDGEGSASSSVRR